MRTPFLAVDGRNPRRAVPKKPWNDVSPVNINKQWYPMVSKCCELDFLRPSTASGNDKPLTTSPPTKPQSQVDNYLRPKQVARKRPENQATLIAEQPLGPQKGTKHKTKRNKQTKPKVTRRQPLGLTQSARKGKKNKFGGRTGTRRRRRARTRRRARRCASSGPSSSPWWALPWPESRSFGRGHAVAAEAGGEGSGGVEGRGGAVEVGFSN